MASHQTILDDVTLLGVGVPSARRRRLPMDALGPLTWVALAGTLLVTVSIGPAPEAGGWLWAIALLLVGMPHGGYDLEAIRRTSPDGSWTAAARPFAIYMVIMFGCVVAITVAPTAALIAFLILTIHHFGHSDSAWTRHQARPELRDRLPAWGHGAAVVASPFLFAPAAAWAPFETIAKSLGASYAMALATLQIAAAIMLAAAAATLCVGLVRLLKTGRSRHALSQAVVLALMLALAASAPPLIAVGAYFLVVHALGHCLTATTPPRSRASTASIANACRVHARSLPLLLPSIVIVLAASGLFVNEPSVLNRVGLAFILFCVAATLPHHMLWAGSDLLRSLETSHRRCLPWLGAQAGARRRSSTR